MLQLLAKNLYSYFSKLPPTNKIFATDLDWTLVRPIRGKFSKNETDWAFLPNRISTLKTYRDAGYTIVIFTNQGGKNLQLSLAKIDNIINVLINEGIDPWVFAATGNDIYRKPERGMWDVFIKNISSIETSFYVGDAGGRPQDFSANDKKFAENIGIQYFVPEDIFPNNIIDIPDTQTMFIFVGMMGSGKTSFYEKYLKPKGYVHINQDTEKTQAKVLKKLREVLDGGKSVAIDATNPTLEKRREYINLAIQYQIPTLIIYFVGNGFGFNALREKPVPSVAYSMYFKNLQEPEENIDGVPVVQIM